MCLVLIMMFHFVVGSLSFDLFAVQGKPSKAVVDSLAVFGVILLIHFLEVSISVSDD